MNIFNREPVMLTGLLQMAVALAASVGLNLTPEQIGTITSFAALILALIARSRVTPTK